MSDSWGKPGDSWEDDLWCYSRALSHSWIAISLSVWVMQVADAIFFYALGTVCMWIVSRNSIVVSLPKERRKIASFWAGKGDRVRVHAPRKSRAGSKTQAMTWPMLSSLSKSPASHLDLCNFSGESVGCLIIFLPKLTIFPLLSFQMGQIDSDGTIFPGSASFTETYLVAFESLVNGSLQLYSCMS